MASQGSVVLCILDGWGASSSVEYNAIHEANTPVWDSLVASCPNSELMTSGLSVGLPEGQMGNSEVGHMNIGSGRIVMQELPRIDQAVSDGSLAQMDAIQGMVKTLKQTGKACHLFGLISPGGVHAHQNHILALAKIVGEAGVKVYLHGFSDGRDVAPSTALKFINEIEESIKNWNLQGVISFATIGGRYYGMDRDQRWDRIQLAYDAIIDAKGAQRDSVVEAVQQSYDASIDDEFIIPAVVGDYRGAKDGDAFIMANFRSDRVRQILSALVMPDFSGFERVRVIDWSAKNGMVEYSSELTNYITPLFPAQKLDNVLGELIAEQKMTQLRISETEKYAHVTFFFNGGREQPFDGEDRILVSSPDVATYDLQPEMSSEELTEKLVAAIESEKYDFIIVNYPNTDMVGHTGVHEAAVMAVESVDHSLGAIRKAVENTDSALFVTADHGNAELMFDEKTGKPNTSHTTNPVPFVLFAKQLEDIKLVDGRLCDIAPTLLDMKGLAIPKEMTGHSLISKAYENQKTA